MIKLIVNCIFTFGLLAFVNCSDDKAALGGAACARDSECGLGNLCVSDICESGCRSSRDCPATTPQCQLDLGDNGSCVTCLTDSECKRGESCESGSCIAKCNSDSDCGSQRCDLTTNRCVECLASSQCQLGEVCSPEQSCASGCFGDRDCKPAAAHCIGATASTPGTCVACAEDRDCRATEACENNACVTSCNRNSDCPGQFCDTGTHACVQCLSTANCQLGSICSQNDCVAGCSGNRDCPTAKPICDIDAGANGTCFECANDNDCEGSETCEQNVCKSPQLADEGEVCLTSQSCAGALLCSDDFRCRVFCVPIFGSCDRPGDVCVGLETGGGVCTPR